MAKDRVRSRRKLRRSVKESPVGRKNLYLFTASLGLLFLGFVALGQGPADSFLSLTVAPILLLAGYCVGIPMAILKRAPQEAAPLQSRPRIDPVHRFALAVSLVALAVYLKTTAPMASFWDTGEFITCSYILGIPHPPGAPLYLLMGRLFSLLPIAPDIGMRLNILSCLFSAAAAYFTFLILVRLFEFWRGKAEGFESRLIAYGGAAVGSLAFAFSDSQWFNSVEAEVYALSLLLMALVIWVALKWSQERDRPGADRLILFIFYVFGLALGVHLLSILVLPIIAMIFYFSRPKLSIESMLLYGAGTFFAFVIIYPGITNYIPAMIAKFSFAAVAVIFLALIAGIWFSLGGGKHRQSQILISLLLVIIGYSVYGTIYVRSGLDPVIDENDPETPARFVSYLNREQYGEWSKTDRRAPLWDYQIKEMYIRYLGWQFVGRQDPGVKRVESDTFTLNGLWGIPFLVGLIGAVHHFRKDRRRAFAVLMLFLMTGLAIVLYVNQENPQPRERDYSYTGSFFAFALWIGMGASAVLQFLAGRMKTLGSKKPVLIVAAAVIFLLVPGNMVVHGYVPHDRSKANATFQFAHDMLQCCDKDAILFTRGDNDTFPIWYAQFVHGVRRDVRLVNMSLLNTNWYIKEMKYEEPTVPIGLSDAEIDLIVQRAYAEPMERTIPIPEDAKERWKRRLKELYPRYDPEDADEMTTVIDPAKIGRPVRPQDLMVIHIIAENEFRRPVHFAVSAPPEGTAGLDRYLLLEGLTFRVVPIPTPDDRMDIDVLRENLFDKCISRNIRDPELLKDRSLRALFDRYRRSFLLLGKRYSGEGNVPEALRVMDLMEKMMPEATVPIGDGALEISFAKLWEDLGRPGDLKKRMTGIVRRYDLHDGNKFLVAASLLDTPEDLASGEEAALAVLRDDPGSMSARSLLCAVQARQGRTAEAIDGLRMWLRNDPGHEDAQRLLSDLLSKGGASQGQP